MVTTRSKCSYAGFSLISACLRLSFTLQPHLQPGQAVSVEVSQHNPILRNHSASPAERLVRRDLPVEVVEAHAGGPLTRHHARPVSTPSRSARLKRRSHLVVPGHIALPFVTDFLELGGDTNDVSNSSSHSVACKPIDCIHIFEKAVNLTLAVKDETADGCLAQADKDSWMNQLVTAMQNSGFQQANPKEVMSKFEQVMNHIEDKPCVKSAVDNNGVYWLQRDPDHFKKCLFDGAAACDDGTSLEAPGGNNGHLCQGDEVCPDTTTFGTLLEGAIHHKRVVTNVWPATSGTTKEIKFCYASGVSQTVKDAMAAAVLHIEQQVGCLKFKEVQSQSGSNSFADTDQQNCAESGSPAIPSILIQNSKSGCWSLVGKHSGTGAYSDSSQPINIGAGCESMGIAAHEIGHAIGMLHEMSRSDRDKYVSLMMDNIPDNMELNFEANTDADAVTSFDFLSLMMYGAYAFSSNGELTIDPKNEKGLVNYMGQRMGFSELDVELIGRLYTCADQVQPITANKLLSQEYLEAAMDASKSLNYNHEGACVDSADEETGFVAPTTDAPMSCSELRIHCSHDTLGPSVRKSCPVSCYVCQPGDGTGTATMGHESSSASSSSKNTTGNNGGATRSHPLLPGLTAASLLLLLARV